LYLPATPIKELSESAAEVLDTLIDACAQLRVCTIDYVRAGAQGHSERMTIHPYALVLYKDTIYCIAWVVERNALRTLRADRMLDADVKATEHFELPAGFSVDDHFEGQFGLFRGSDRIRVVVDFDADVADLVRGRPFPGPDPGEPSTCDLPSGGVRVVMTVSATTEVIPWILSFGKKVRVIEPLELAASVANEARAIFRHYGA
jgi:predicted DNA-binding transcriptional regulator YafY